MLYTPSYGNSQLKMEILEFTSEEASAPLMSVAAPIWFWKFRKKTKFFGIFLQILKIMENVEKLQIIISKIRWEGYIGLYEIAMAYEK